MPEIHRFDSVDSTMVRAAALAAAGCESGTVVVAGEQTAGQGRHGHSWHSEKDAGLYMSEVLRLKMGPDTLPIVTLALGLATAEAITDETGVACDLRWPNDVLIDGKKCAGILVQLVDSVLILGIGINVNHTAFPAELAGIATSLRLATGREHSSEQLLDKLVGAIDEHLDTLTRLGKDAVLRAFARASSYVRGRRVVVDFGDGILEGTTDGLDPQGFLVLRREDGRRTLILAGGVRPACY
jgi:BirA family transcriptional regulator, biotin operon repressor / biotin---[acetyl-CoA-carboxylase] ligase